jgi:hypothetical protein
MSPRRAYLLMPWGRVGSNLVLQAMAQSPAVRCENEPLTAIRAREADPDAAQKDWMRRSLEDPEPRVRLVNLSLRSIVDDDFFLEAIRADAAAGAAVVFLERRNPVEVAFSALRAEHYAAVHRERFGRATWAVRRGREIDLRTPVDPARFLGLLDAVAADARRMARWRAALPGLDLYYSDVALSLAMVVEEICARLDLPVPRYEVDMVKAIRRPYAAEFEGYEALRAEVARRRPDLLGVFEAADAGAAAQEALAVAP